MRLLRAGLTIALLAAGDPAGASAGAAAPQAAPRSTGGKLEAVPDQDLSSDPEARGFAELLFAQGRLELEDGKLPEALEKFERAAAIYPQDATYIYFAGLVVMRLGAPGEAAVRIAQALPPATCRTAEWRIRADLGTALYQDDRAREAEPELRAALNLQPGDAATHFTLGLVLLDLGRRDEARVELTIAGRSDVSLSNDAEQLRESAVGEVVPEAGALPKLEFRVSPALEYDGNPEILSEESSKLILPAKGQGGDLRAVLALRGEWHPFLGWHGLSSGLVLKSYFSRYDDLSVLDQWTPQGLFQLAWGSDPDGFVNGPLGYVRVPGGHSPVAIVFQGGGSGTWLDRRKFEREYIAALGVSVPWTISSEPLRTQLDLLYEKVGYSGSFSGRSNHTNSVRLSQYVQFGRSDRFLRVGYNFSDLDADGTQVFDPGKGGFVLDRDAFDSENKGWFADLSLPLWEGAYVFIEGSRFKEDFDTLYPFDPFNPLPRRDKTVKYAAGLVIPLSAHCYLTGRFERQKRDSGIDPLSYRRRVSSIGATWHW